jgi:hypothetical protein
MYTFCSSVIDWPKVCHWGKNIQNILKYRRNTDTFFQMFNMYKLFILLYYFFVAKPSQNPTIEVSRALSSVQRSLRNLENYLLVMLSEKKSKMVTKLLNHFRNVSENFWDRYYDFLNIFAEKISKNWRFWLKTKLNYANF